MQKTIFTNIKCREIVLSNANENWYIILCDLFSRLWYIATCGPFYRDATHLLSLYRAKIFSYFYLKYQTELPMSFSCLAGIAQKYVYSIFVL